MTTLYRRLPKFDYLRPGSLIEALSLLDEHGESARVMAGGTDLIPQLKRREIVPPRYIIDLKEIDELKGLTYSDKTGLTIGALTTISAIEGSMPVREHYYPLYQAASGMASPQVRNRGTFAGNICSAVPSADSAPGLLVLGSVVRLKSLKGERRVTLEKFFKGPRITSIKPNELLTAIVVPKPDPNSRGVYLKLSPRHSMDLAIVGVAAQTTYTNTTCRDVKVALGAVAPTPLRATKAESVLKGRKPSPALIDEAARVASTECRPIDDHRASAEYRCDMVYAMMRRALEQIFFEGGLKS